jgi:hypothetical protein
MTAPPRREDEPAPAGAQPCAHAARVDGVCSACGDCEHDVILNGACLACGTTDLDPIAISPKRVTLIPAAHLSRRL